MDDEQGTGSRVMREAERMLIQVESNLSQLQEKLVRHNLVRLISEFNPGPISVLCIIPRA